MASFLRYRVKELSEYTEDASALLENIDVVDIRNGMWIIHSKNGYVGRTGFRKSSKPGKHGRRKISYTLKFPHNDTTDFECFRQGWIVKRAIVRTKDYLVLDVINHYRIVVDYCSYFAKSLSFPSEILDL